MSKEQDAATQTAKLDIRVYPIAEPKNNTLAFASVTINDMIAVHGIRVMDSEKGRFASMPSQKDTKGEYREVCHPITGDFRKQLNAEVLAAYDEALAKGPQEKASVRDQIRDGAKDAKAKPTPDKDKSAKKTAPDR
jgi:stage V sporulation protein G